MSESDPPPSLTWLHCNHCETRTKHSLSFTHEHDWATWDADEERFPSYVEYLQWTMWVCNGCETPLVQCRYNFNHDCDEKGETEYSYEYHPSRNEFSYPIRQFSRIPDEVNVIYREACAAYNAKLPLLCAGGLRALTEAICRDKGVSGRDLQKKIDALKSFLPESLVGNLHGLRYLGNDALHELKPPEMSNLRLGLDVLGDLMNYFYDLDYKAALLAKRHVHQK